MLLAVGQAVAHLQHQPFPGGQGGQHPLHLLQRHASDDGVLDLVRVRAQDVHVGDLIALAVGTHAVLQGHIPAVLPAGTQCHEDLVLDAPGGVGAKGGAGISPEAVHRLDQADDADGDQVVRTVAGHSVFAGDVADQAQIVGDERLTGVFVPLQHAQDEGFLLLSRQLLGKFRLPGDVSQKKQPLPHEDRQKFQHGGSLL